MKLSQQVRRPLVGMALSFVAGLFFQEKTGASPWLLLSLSAFPLAIIGWRSSLRKTWAVYLSIGLIAAAYGAVEKTKTPLASVLPIAEVTGSQQKIIGVVNNDPQTSVDHGDQSFRLRVRAVLFGEHWMPADGVINVYMRSPVDSVEYGERWILSGSYRSYPRAYSGAEGALSVKENSAREIAEAPWSLRGFCYRIRSQLASRLDAGEGRFPDRAKLLHALLLGYRKALPRDLYQMFVRTGTLHVFAISGLHVGVMAAILIAGLKIIGVSRVRWGVFLVPILLFYVISTGMKASAFRAFTMAAVYFCAPLFKRRPDSASAIAVAALLLLLINPGQLMDLGFIFSFTVVSGIVMVHTFVAKKMHGIRTVSGWAASVGQLNSSGPARFFVRSVGALLLTSVAAWLFSMPLTARFFHTVSPVALLGNLFIIPLTFMIVLTGCLTALTPAVFNVICGIFNQANGVFIGWLIAAIHRLDSLPFAYFFVRGPSFGQVAVWYAGMVLFFAGPVRVRRWGLALPILALLFWFLTPGPLRNDLELWRAKDAFCVLRTPEGGWTVVTDGGEYSESIAVRRLKELGVNRLDLLAVSGYQHSAPSIQAICDTFSVKKIQLPAALSDPKATADNVVFSDKLSVRAGTGLVVMDLAAD